MFDILGVMLSFVCIIVGATIVSATYRMIWKPYNNLPYALIITLSGYTYGLALIAVGSWVIYRSV